MIVIKFSNFFVKVSNYCDFLKKESEENSYQVHSMLKKSKIFKIEVHYCVEHCGINFFCHSIFRNVVIDPQLQTSLNAYFEEFSKIFKYCRNCTLEASFC